MLTQILKSAEWREFADFVSPALFRVMPVARAWRVVNTLRKNRQNDLLRQSATDQRRRSLESARLGIALEGIAPRPPAPAPLGAHLDPERHAQTIVQLYFHQLFTDDLTLLDLRPRGFDTHDGALMWCPAPWLWRWEASFIGSLRDVYRGFYAGDDELFRDGLRRLHLEPAEDIFRRHFGANQAQVRFSSKDFVSTFHDVFLCCRKHGLTLDPSFLPLGLYLATLYEHLESLGVPVDVRRAFADAAPRSVSALSLN
jgi:hypothetical protein